MQNRELSISIHHSTDQPNKLRPIYNQARPRVAGTGKAHQRKRVTDTHTHASSTMSAGPLTCADLSHAAAGQDLLRAPLYSLSLSSRSKSSREQERTTRKSSHARALGHERAHYAFICARRGDMQAVASFGNYGGTAWNADDARDLWRGESWRRADMWRYSGVYGAPTTRADARDFPVPILVRPPLLSPRAIMYMRVCIYV